MRNALFLLIPFLAYIALAATAANLGQPLPLKLSQPGDLPHFGATYTLASDPDGLNYLWAFDSGLTAGDLRDLPVMLRWNVFDKLSGQFILAWDDVRSISKSGLVVGQLRISE